MLVEGKIAGTWGRVTKGAQVTVKLAMWRPVTAPVKRALAAAARSYGAFVERTVTVAQNTNWMPASNVSDGL